MKTRTSLALVVAGVLTAISCGMKFSDSVESRKSLSSEIERLEEHSFGPYTMQKLKELYSERFLVDLYAQSLLCLVVASGASTLTGGVSLIDRKVYNSPPTQTQ